MRDTPFNVEAPRLVAVSVFLCAITARRVGFSSFFGEYLVFDSPVAAHHDELCGVGLVLT